jgi:hypothetical protein
MTLIMGDLTFNSRLSNSPLFTEDQSVIEKGGNGTERKETVENRSNHFTINPSSEQKVIDNK